LRELRWAAEALDDLDRIAAFNEQRSFEWALRVQHAITSQAERLVEAPLRAPRQAGSPDRTVLISDFQYVLTYAVDDAFVVVKSVRHTREDR
jgi:plasmid stabilization system protein ParE